MRKMAQEVTGNAMFLIRVRSSNAVTVTMYRNVVLVFEVFSVLTEMTWNHSSTGSDEASSSRDCGFDSRLRQISYLQNFAWKLQWHCNIIFAIVKGLQ